jgi:hypothetical protein
MIVFDLTVQTRGEKKKKSEREKMQAWLGDWLVLAWARTSYCNEVREKAKKRTSSLHSDYDLLRKRENESQGQGIKRHTERKVWCKSSTHWQKQWWYEWTEAEQRGNEVYINVCLSVHKRNIDEEEEWERTSTRTDGEIDFWHILIQLLSWKGLYA